LSQRQLLHAILLRQDHCAHGFKISDHLLRWCIWSGLSVQLERLNS
jgi:hypothetical protein